MEKKLLSYNMSYYSLEELENTLNDPFNFFSASDISFENDLLVNNHECCITDDEHPLALGTCYIVNSNECLYINKKFYEENKEKIDNIIIKIIRSENSRFGLHGPLLLDDKFINEIINNKSITEISIRCIDPNGSGILTEELYLKLKECGHITSIYSNGVAEELSENFDSIISYNQYINLFGSYTYSSLNSNEKIILDRITPDQIPNMKYINPNAKLSCFFDDFKLTNIDYDIFEQVLKYMKENNMSNKLVIHIDDIKKQEFNNFMFSHFEMFNELNVEIKYNNKNYSFEEYYTYENRLESLIKDAYNLSPMEKYLYVYDIVKKFKEYKESESSPLAARNIYEILDNEYMVCVGYASLLVDLLKRLGIVAKEISTTVAIGFEKIKNKDINTPDIDIKKGNHARAEVFIDDPKYGVSGIYLCDPTWDNDLENDRYLYAFLTRDKYDSIYRENITNDDIILYSKDTLEFYQMIDYLVNHNLAKQREIEFDKIQKIKQENEISFSTSLKYTKEDLTKMIDAYMLKKYNIKFTNNYHIGFYNHEDFINHVIFDILKYMGNDIIGSHVDDTNEIIDIILLKQYHKKDDISEVVGRAAREAYSYCIDVYGKCFINITNTLTGYLEIFDNEFYQYLQGKYKDLRFSFSSDAFNEILEHCSEFFDKNFHNEISLDTLLLAIENVYRAKGLKEEEIQIKLENIIKYNKEKEGKNFPQRYIIHQDGTKEKYNPIDYLFIEEDKTKAK